MEPRAEAVRLSRARVFRPIRMPQNVTKNVDLKTECSTAEVTHVLEAIRLEGQCYVKNHLLMGLVGQEGPLRKWHDNVTRKNLEAFKPLAEKMGIALPFPQPLEDRENDLKAKLQNANVADTLTMGEALAEVKTTGIHLAEFYTTSFTLATSDEVKKAFRTGLTNVMDNLDTVENELKKTDQYYPPPVAQKVGLVAEKGVSQ